MIVIIYLMQKKTVEIIISGTVLYLKYTFLFYHRDSGKLARHVRTCKYGGVFKARPKVTNIQEGEQVNREREQGGREQGGREQGGTQGSLLSTSELVNMAECSRLDQKLQISRKGNR